MVAAFQVGWEVEHLKSWEPSPRDNRDWVVRKVLRMESALKELEAMVPASNGGAPPGKKPPPRGEVGDDPFAAAECPSTAALRDAVRKLPEIMDGHGSLTDFEAELKEFHSAVDDFDARFWRAVLVASESAALSRHDGDSQQPPAAVAAAVADAFHLGLKLASISLAGARAKNEAALRAAVSCPHSGNTAEAYALASRLRGSFPAGAAYAVARHIEDWSAWVNGLTLDWEASPRNAGKVPTMPRVDLKECRNAMFRQGKVWESLLTGQSLGKDYLVASSYADAANHILVTWCLSTASIARSMRRTAMGKLVFGFMGLALVVSLGTLIYQFALTPGVRSDGMTGPTTATIVTVLVGVLGSAAGLFHYARSHLAMATARIWALTEPALVSSEILEAIAIATRRLPAEGMSGGAGGGEHRTFNDRHRRAKNAALASPVRRPAQRLTAPGQT